MDSPDRRHRMSCADKTRLHDATSEGWNIRCSFCVTWKHFYELWLSARTDVLLPERNNKKDAHCSTTANTASRLAQSTVMNCFSASNHLSRLIHSNQLATESLLAHTACYQSLWRYRTDATKDSFHHSIHHLLINVIIIERKHHRQLTRFTQCANIKSPHKVSMFTELRWCTFLYYSADVLTGLSKIILADDVVQHAQCSSALFSTSLCRNIR